MAIKINWKDLVKRYIDWKEVVKVMRDWTQIWPAESPEPVARSFWNQSLWLISILGTDNVWRTFADKDLWAVLPWDPSAEWSQDYAWAMFQFWNNYWFPYNWEFNRSCNSGIDLSSYAPSTYSSSVFNTCWTSCWPFNDIWGAQTNTYEAMKWPCPSWFHIMTNDETNAFINASNGLTYIKFLAPWMEPIMSNGRYENKGPRVVYRWPWYIDGSWNFVYNSWWRGWEGMDSRNVWRWFRIRPMRNTSLIPSGSWWVEL